MIKFTVTCRMISRRDKVITGKVDVMALDSKSARREAQEIFWRRGFQVVEPLMTTVKQSC